MDESRIKSFQNLTNASRERAVFYLEAANGELDSAVASYFDNNDDASPSNSAGMSGPRTLSGAPAPMPSLERGAASSSLPLRQSKSGAQSSRLQTLSDLKAANDKGDDSDEEQGDNTYFAGGDKSGLLMKGPPKRKSGAEAGANDLVQTILGQAARAGPVPEEFQASAQPKWFTGTGVKLNDSSSTSAAVPEATASREPVERVLTFWRNGFSVDDGELLSFDDPGNQELLKAIKSGHAPSALMNVTYGQPVNVKVAHRLQEDYQPPPKKPVKAFSGSGQRLGSVVPGTVTRLPVSQGSSSSSHRPNVGLQIDPSQPTTSLQIRLHDGTKLVAKFNQTHTVQDVINFINSSRPNESSTPYRLFAGFPTKEITNYSTSLKDEGLLNSVVLQKR